jgi:hypothetical protein
MWNNTVILAMFLFAAGFFEDNYGTDWGNWKGPGFVSEERELFKYLEGEPRA